MTTEKSTGDNKGWFWVVVILLVVGGIYFFYFRPHPPTADELVGAWSCTDKPWVFEFSKGDAVLMQTLGAVRAGSYRVETDGTLKVDMNDGKGFKAKAELKGDELTLADADGTKSTFKRGTPSLTPPLGPGSGPGTNPPPPPPPDPDLDRAVQESLKVRDTKWTVCTTGTGPDYLFTKLIAPKQNTFTPVLGAPPEGTTIGFYQFSMPTPWEHQVVSLTAADQLNGIRKRYRIRWFSPAYRTWDGLGLKKWSDWQTGRGAEKDKVNFLNSTVTLMASGQWKVEEGYNLGTTNPLFLAKPACNEIP